MQIITDNGVYVLANSSLWIDDEGNLRVVSDSFKFHNLPVGEVADEDDA